MARRKNPATAVIVIAAMLGMAAIAKAAQEDGPRWPSIYEPQWPNFTGATSDKPAKPAPSPAPEPEIVTGSVPPSPVEKRWHDFKAERTIVVPAFEGEFGLRYWMNWGTTAKNLYNIRGTAPISRLTYDGLTGQAGEAFGRVDFNSGFFIKGNVGAGILTGGQLIDEDWIAGQPYSWTKSDQRDGTIAYATFDLGFNIIRRPGFRLGAFAGYHYLDHEVNAYGCAQAAGNPNICVPTIPNEVLGITQNNQWHSLRVGLDADIKLGGPFSVKLDAAYLPYVKLNGGDTHWLRVGTTPGSFTGEIPEDGQGRGYQLEAALQYAYSPNVNFAVGGRYWRMDTHGNTHFENHVVGVTASPQPVDWKVESYGVFVQGSFKFGPYPIGGF